jgi:hypothetical protein
MPSTNLSTNTDGRADTSTYFTNLHGYTPPVPVNTDSAVHTFFEEYTGNKEAGKLLADAVIYTALSRNMNPMEVIAEFKKLSSEKLSMTLATFLNQSRVNTSFIGVMNSPKTSFFVQRSILA